ncbi:MAG: glycoside hydrolase family 18 [Bacteroidales bacterium]|nr:glycoside hydrolase family 18 [Bacteroidales bacterium]
MKKTIYTFSIAAAILVSCTKEEALVIQKVPSPGDELFDEQYYQNLRDWKNSDHIRTYVYYAAWAPLEGASSMYKEPTTMAERFIGLPDSLDIVNLWMGIPSADPADEYEYSPVAAADMKYCQEKKGTRFVMHADASHYRHQFTVNGKDYDLSQDRSEEAICAYADYNAQQVLHFGLDGIDYDFEGWSAADMTVAIRQSAKYFGSQAETEEGRKMLNIIDYFNGAPSEDVEPYVSFIVRQAYSQQIGNRYTGLVRPSWLPAEKYIICEQWNQGNNRFNGGYVPYRGYNNETLMTYDESGNYVQMASLEAYARFCSDGNAGGFGAYYIDSDYFFSKGPYWNLRRCIQIGTPSIH